MSNDAVVYMRLVILSVLFKIMSSIGLLVFPLITINKCGKWPDNSNHLVTH